MACTLPTSHSPCRRLQTTAAPQTSSISLSRGRCWLLSDQNHIGCHNNKKYPTITTLSNICEYCPVPSNPIPVSFYIRKRIYRFFLHNFDKSRHSFVIFGMNHPDSWGTMKIENMYCCVIQLESEAWAVTRWGRLGDEGIKMKWF